MSELHSPPHEGTCVVDGPPEPHPEFPEQPCADANPASDPDPTHDMVFSAAELATETTSPGDIEDYELLEEIGRGPRGVVYRARQISLDRVVALKVIADEEFTGEGTLQRFLGEVESATLLSDPRIVPILGVGTQGDSHYYSMMPMEGGNLADHLEEYKADPRAAARMLAVIARAVHYLHQSGLLHRNLKPANILFDDSGQPHLSDLGMPWAAAPFAGASASTFPWYQAPEQTRDGQALTPATDVFSLGVVFHEMLTGKPLFPEPISTAPGRPVRPSLWNPRVPPALDAIALRCLEGDPERRYASAEPLAEDLERWLVGDPVASPRSIVRTHPTNKWRWKRILAGGVTLALVAAALGVALGSRRPHHPVKEQPTEPLPLIPSVAGPKLLEPSLAPHLVLEMKKQAQLGAGMARLAAEDAVQRALAMKQIDDQVERERMWASRRAALELYYPNLSSALEESAANRSARAVVLLDACPAELRSWEWHVVKHLCQSSVQTVPGHLGGATAVAYRLGGKQIASTGRDQRIRIWDTERGQTVHTLTGHKDAVLHVSFSADGLWLASASRDGTIKVWDAESGQLVHTLGEHSGWVCGVALNPEGTRLASAGLDGTVRLWDVKDGRQLLTLEAKAGVTCVAFRPDGNQLAWADLEGNVTLVDPATGKGALSFHANKGAVWCLAFHPEGQMLATGGESIDDQGEVRLWSLKDGSLLKTLRGHKGDILSLAFTFDGKRLASASRDATIKLWELDPEREVATLRGHRGKVTGVAFSPDGRRLVSAGFDGAVKLWNASSFDGEQ